MPKRKNPNRILILLETKSGKEGIENFIGNKGEVIASSKKQIDNGGTAVVAIKNHKYDPTYQKLFEIQRHHSL